MDKTLFDLFPGFFGTVNCDDPNSDTARRLRAYNSQLAAQGARRRAEAFCFNLVVSAALIGAACYFLGII